MEEPQPNAPLEDDAAAAAQPSEEPQAPAAEPQEPQQTSQQPSDDDENFDYDAWLQQKGVDPSTPEGKAAIAKSWRGIEQKMHAATTEASEIKKSLAESAPPVQEAGVDPDIKEFIQDYRQDKMLSSFKEAHPDWKQYDKAMGNLMYEQVQTPYGVFARGQLVKAGLMSLDDVYYRAKAASPVDTKQIKTQAQQEVLQTLANTQRAGGGTAHASDTSPKAPADKDAFLEGLMSNN